MVRVESILDVVPALGVVLALVYYSMTLRYTTKARQRELIFLRSQSYRMEYARAYANIVNHLDWEDPEDWFEKYGRLTNPEAFSNFLYIMNTYNLAGVLLKEKEADQDLIFKLYHPNAVIPVWEHFEPVIRYVRNNHRYSEWLEPFEFLYKEAKKKYPEIPPLRLVL